MFIRVCVLIDGLHIKWFLSFLHELDVCIVFKYMFLVFLFPSFMGFHVLSLSTAALLIVSISYTRKYVYDLPRAITGSLIPPSDC